MVKDRSIPLLSESVNPSWIQVEDRNRSKIILESYADEQKRSILNVTAAKPLTFLEIAEICKIPKASCYRKIITLMKEGLLVKEDIDTGTELAKYKSTFEEIKVNVKKDAIIVHVRPA